MDLIIDTNRIMAGLLKDSTSRSIILHESFSFFAPDYTGTELLKHRDYLRKKAKIPDADFDLVLQTLLDHITLVAFEDFSREYDRAVQIMKPIDEDDAPFLAVGLALDIPGIWTEDRHFLRQEHLKVWSTRDLISQVLFSGEDTR